MHFTKPDNQHQDNSKAGPPATDTVAGLKFLPSLTADAGPLWRDSSMGVPARFLAAITALRRACTSRTKCLRVVERAQVGADGCCMQSQQSVHKRKACTYIPKHCTGPCCMPRHTKENTICKVCTSCVFCAISFLKYLVHVVLCNRMQHCVG